MRLFYYVLLSRCRPDLLQEWVPILCPELVKRSLERPLVSGFYRLVTLVFKETARTGYFDDGALQPPSAASHEVNMPRKSLHEIVTFNLVDLATIRACFTQPNLTAFCALLLSNAQHQLVCRVCWWLVCCCYADFVVVVAGDGAAEAFAFFFAATFHVFAAARSSRGAVRVV